MPCKKVDANRRKGLMFFVFTCCGIGVYAIMSNVYLRSFFAHSFVGTERFLDSFSSVHYTNRTLVGNRTIRANKTIRKDHIENRANSQSLIFPVKHAKTRGGQLCKIPDIDLYPNEHFRIHFRDVPKIKCPGEEWVSVEGGVFRILKWVKKKYGNVTCDYLPVLKGNHDSDVHHGEIVKNIKDGWNVTSEGSKITCNGVNGVYSNYHLTVPYVEKIHRRLERVKLPTTSLGLNVLAFVFDSVSRMNWLRKLPKSYKYMKEVLGSVVLEGYNIVDDGTLGAYFPMFTGSFERELNLTKGEPLDDVPWIWNDFKRAGYVSNFAEDVRALVASFTWRLSGFKNYPTDHGVISFYTDEAKNHVGHRLCMGPKVWNSVLLNYAMDFEKMYKGQRKFSFNLAAHTSHDYIQSLNIVDDDFKEWIKGMHEGGILNNTLLLLMSDHGSRYKSIRETLQGSIEERNPFVSLRVPLWFRKRYPDVYKNILINSKRLTTPFDIHATLRDILNFEYRPRGQLSNRGISLFSEIPSERLCSHAGVNDHYCNCLTWKHVKDMETVKNAALAFVDFLNTLTDSNRNICQNLTLDRVQRAKVLTPQDLVKERLNPTGYGKIPLVNDNAGKTIYQMVVHTKPGGGHFEVTMEYDSETKKYNNKLQDVSRINVYGSDASCLKQDKDRWLASFCYCKK